MNPLHEILIPLAIGFLLDTLIGDPVQLPHPIRWFGHAIAFFDKRLNKGGNRKLKGLIMVVILLTATFLLFYIVVAVSKTSLYIYYPLTSILVFYGLANRNLIDEALKVERKLSKEGIASGRKQLSFIVGRETDNLSENKIRIAVLETLSENLSDGVIAPLFYYAIGGVPLMFVYKMINTLDSMVGYKSEKYKYFGRVAAKVDDVANYIPARITALLMAMVSFSSRAVRHIVTYGHLHASPNAGYPEAALSGILNCRFGGPNSYHGKLLNKPYIGLTDRKINTADIYKACVINYKASLVFVIIILVFYTIIL